MHQSINVNHNILQQLIEHIDVYPADGPIQKPQGAGDQVAWHQLEVGKSYWALSTGFLCEGSEPRRFTVTSVTQFPDGGAIIWTNEARWAYGVGAYCESALGPRNRFWLA